MGQMCDTENSNTDLCLNNNSNQIRPGPKLDIIILRDSYFLGNRGKSPVSKEILGHNSVKILVFLSPSSYKL